MTALITHCKNGHRYEAVGYRTHTRTRHGPDGTRTTTTVRCCNRCQDAKNERARQLRAAVAARNHRCKRGHDDWQTTGSGKKRCRACQRLGDQTRAAKRKELASGRTPAIPISKLTEPQATEWIFRLEDQLELARPDERATLRHAISLIANRNARRDAQRTTA